MVVLCHTREVAIQTWNCALQLANGTGLKCHIIHGGGGSKVYRVQERKLADGCDLLVATPGMLVVLLLSIPFTNTIAGRLVELLGGPERSRLTLKELQLMIFDEADILLTTPFDEVLAGIRNRAPVLRKYTMWFCASSLTQAAVDCMQDNWLVPQEPAETLDDLHPFYTSQDAVWLASQNEDWYDHIASKTATSFVEARVETRLEATRDLVREFSTENFLTLVNETALVDQTAAIMRQEWTVATSSLHGKCTQQHREKSMREFNRGESRILVATIRHFSHGIDLPQVSRLIFLRLPDTMAVYRSAAGRVGRLGRPATIHVFYDQANLQEVEMFRNISSGNVDKAEFSLRDALPHEKQ